MMDAAIILCGGGSLRMGRDKAALPFGPDTLLARVVDVAQVVASEIVVVGDTSQSMPAGIRVVRDPVPGLGPLAALATGLTSVGAERALLLACDMPLLVPALLRRLQDLAGDADACVPRRGRNADDDLRRLRDARAARARRRCWPRARGRCARCWPRCPCAG